MRRTRWLLVAVGLCVVWHRQAMGNDADRAAMDVTRKVTMTSSPRTGIVLTTDTSPPATHSGTPVVRVSQDEADAVLAFLTDSGFIASARRRREVCFADHELMALHIDHAGVMRTGCSGITLQSLGYLERVSDALTPAAQQEFLSAIDSIKNRHFRTERGRHVIPLWMSRTSDASEE